MERVYLYVSKQLLEQEPKLLALIRKEYGEYIIEGEIPGDNRTVSVSFYTDKLIFIEGENKRVDITCTVDPESELGYKVVELKKV